MRRTGPTVVLAFFALMTVFAKDASAQGRRPSPCRYNQLSVRHVSDDAAMGGGRSVGYAFKNTSTSPCRLEGYPRFEVLNGTGRLVRGGRAADGLKMLGDEAKAPPNPVTLVPGEEAAFLVYYNAGGAGRMRRCPTYGKVRITAPGAGRGFILRESLRLCGDLQVSPVGSPAAGGH